MSVTDSSISQEKVNEAASSLRAGGVIAYPTEHCFGLGCDPLNVTAVERLLKIKKRQAAQGVILVAANLEQVEAYVDLDASPMRAEIEASWPGPNTWILPARAHVTHWVRGKHAGVAMRISAHPVCQQLCQSFGAAIVSTSANRHGQSALLSAADVENDMGDELDFVLDAPLGGAERPSIIKDGVSGVQLR